MNTNCDMVLMALMCIIMPIIPGYLPAKPVELSETAYNVAQEIRKEALMPPNGPQGHPLPLVSHWNMGSYGKGWTPDYQVELLNKGHHILPWMAWPQGNPDSDERTRERFIDYYGKLILYCRELRLPMDTSLDSARPWDSKTSIPVFSLALVQGTEGSRRWLLYAHAPLENQKDVKITIPDYGSVTVEVPRSGAFYLIEEQAQITTPVTMKTRMSIPILGKI